MTLLARKSGRQLGKSTRAFWGLAACALLSAAFALAFSLSFAGANTAFGAEGTGEEGAASSSSQSASSQSAASVDNQDANIVDPTQRADNSFIYDTTIEDILSEPSSKEGQTVQFTGEAIGDAIIATPGGDYTWVMVSSTTASGAGISVLMTTEQAKQIDHFGRYGVTGTIVQVRGTFHQACSEHEGLMDLHATNVAVVTRGVEHPDTFVASNFLPGLLAVIVGAVFMAVFYFARERMR